MKSWHLPPAAALALAGASALPLAAFASRSAVAVAVAVEIGLADGISDDLAAFGLSKLRDPQWMAGEMSAFGPVMRRRDDRGRHQEFAAPCPNSTRSAC
jgi:hypothetical protein